MHLHHPRRRPGRAVRPRAGVLVLLAILALCALAVPAAAAPTASPAAQPVLRFATLPAESAIPLIAAVELGLFEREGLTVELLPFNSPIDRNVAAQAGKLDAMIADVMTAIAFREAGLDYAITSDINEDFKLLVSPKSGIRDYAGLNGKDVAVVPNFALEYIMDRLAARNGISYRLVNIPSIPARFEALLADRLTGVVFTEPQATLLASRGCTVLGGSRAEGLQAGALLVSRSWLAANPVAAKGFYRAVNAAAAWLAEPGSAERIAPVLARYGFPDAVKSYLAATRYHPASPISEAAFADILAWCRTKGLAKREHRLADLADQRYLP